MNNLRKIFSHFNQEFSLKKMTPEQKVKAGYCKEPGCFKKLHFAKSSIMLSYTTGHCQEHYQQHRESHD